MAQKTILTPLQEQLIELVRQDDDIRAKFYLTGGTALAEFYLRHRRSEDLDFFTDEPVGKEEVVRFIDKVENKLKLPKFRYEKIHDRHGFILEHGKTALKLEFVYYNFPASQKRRRVRGLLVDSLKDIAANKLFAATDRREPKDLVDLAFIFQEKLAPRATVRAVEKKFGIKIGKLMLADLYNRGAKTMYLGVRLARRNEKWIRGFYTNELKKLGKAILMP